MREILRAGQSRDEVGQLTLSVPVLNQMGPIQDGEPLWQTLQLQGFRPGKEAFAVLLSRGQALGLCLGLSGEKEQA